MSADAHVEHVAVSSPDHTSTHEIRITAHGKMQAWVDFALRFFEVGPVNIRQCFFSQRDDCSNYYRTMTPVR